jgi:hypothetical protein
MGKDKKRNRNRKEANRQGKPVARVDWRKRASELLAASQAAMAARVKDAEGARPAATVSAPTDPPAAGQPAARAVVADIAPVAPVSGRAAGSTAVSTRALAGGRVTVDTEQSLVSGAMVMIAQLSDDETWRTLNLDASTLDRMSPAELLEKLANLSPDVSRAVWDFLRMINPGWTLTALQPDKDERHPAGQAALDAFVAQLSTLYGAFDVVLGRLSMGAFLRGGYFGELVLDKAGRKPIDLATPDPITVRWLRINDPARGLIWQAGQYQLGNWVVMDRPTIIYIPIDPFPGRPEGRALATPALFTALFLLGLLHDLRRVVAQQGYPRIDIAIDFEKLAASMPEDAANDPQKFKEWADGVVADVSRAYSGLQPDDAYIHSTVIGVNRPVGTVDAESLGGIDGLIKSLERMSVRALKSMPLMMGINDATTETNANRQWEIHVAGIKSIQHLCETMLEVLFGLALQAQGIAARVQFRFAELRAAELLRDAQVQTLNTQVAIAQYAAGWISQDEAAQKTVGHAADQQTPRAVAGNIAITGNNPLGSAETAQGEAATNNADTGTARVQMPAAQRGIPDENIGVGGVEIAEIESGRRRAHQNGGGCACPSCRDMAMIGGRSVKIIPEGADEPLPAVPDEVVISEADIRKAIDAWDSLMPDYSGLLEATVIGQTNFDAQQHALRPAGTRLYGDASPWTWDPAGAGGGRYRNTETGRWLGQKQMIGLRDQFIDAQKQAVSDLADRFSKGDITIQQWTLESRGLIKQGFIDQYVMAHGGRFSMTQRDWGIIGSMCKDQYGYLNAFGEAINNGELSAGQIAVRAGLYIDSSVQAFERGTSERLGIPDLPAYPGDGSTSCLGNCRCSWQYEETDTAWNCTWQLDTAAEHCVDCEANAAQWAPLVIPKDTGGRSVGSTPGIGVGDAIAVTGEPRLADFMKKALLALDWVMQAPSTGESPSQTPEPPPCPDHGEPEDHGGEALP